MYIIIVGLGAKKLQFNNYLRGVKMEEIKIIKVDKTAITYSVGNKNYKMPKVWDYEIYQITLPPCNNRAFLKSIRLWEKLQISKVNEVLKQNQNNLFLE